MRQRAKQRRRVLCAPAHGGHQKLAASEETAEQARVNLIRLLGYREVFRQRKQHKKQGPLQCGIGKMQKAVCLHVCKVGQQQEKECEQDAPEHLFRIVKYIVDHENEGEKQNSQLGIARKRGHQEYVDRKGDQDGCEGRPYQGLDGNPGKFGVRDDNPDDDPQVRQFTRYVRYVYDDEKREPGRRRDPQCLAQPVPIQRETRRRTGGSRQRPA